MYNENTIVTERMLPLLGRGLGRGLFLLFTFYSILATAQNFPVQVIPQAVPPAPIYISNYADASTVTSPLRVQLILNDFEIANREVRLKTYFVGPGLNFESNDLVVGAPSLFLEGGVPLVLTNVELAPYFQFENISGISPNVYGQPIPEGAYQFCFEVYDVLTGSRLSNRSCAVSVVFQNEPPFLVLPGNRTNVDEVNPQFINFQWTPRSINVTNVEYELSLVEIWDTQVDPQQAFLSSPPVFQTTTSATTYVYGPADPLLLSGKNYAWRVQAKAKQGTEEIGLFKNQGFSEIYSFSYAGACELPIGIDHEVKGSTNANIFWDDFSTDVPEYTVRYRQKNTNNSSPGGGAAGGGGNEWFLSKTNSNNITIWDLRAGGTYEYQLQNTCAVAASEWSIVKEFTTFIADDEDSVYDCNISPDFNLTNRELLPSMGVGDKFTAGDFPINVLEVNGSNGRFNGKGYVTIPYLNSIRVGVAFTNIVVNTENQLIEGEVLTIYDPTLSNILDVDDAIDTVEDVVDSVGEFFEGDNDLDEIQVDWTIGSKDDITIEDGMVVITNPYNGVTKTEPLGDDMVITDQEGNTYYVSPEGEITEGGQITPGEEVNPGNVSGVSNNGDLESLTAENIKVTFNTKGTYGFDQMPSAANNNEKLKKEYTIIKDASGNDYVLPHHAVKKGGTTQIQAKIDVQNNAYTPDQVVFKNKQGKIIKPSAINGTIATLSLEGVYTFENETIYAVVPSKEDADKQLTAGAFTLWHLEERTINVAIVSVGATVGDVSTTVNEIFGNGLAKINFKNTISLNANDVRAALGANGMDVGESPLTAAYNDEQKALRALAKAAGANDSDTYYVIVLGNEFSNTKSIAGFMPLQRQFGFVFEQYADSGEEAKGTIAKTVAHEIGHGVFALQHPFTQYSIPESSTDWLMDYSNGTNLPHTHWSQMHDPAIRFYVFQDEEDGEIAGKIWFSPDWDPISVSGTNSIYTGHLLQNPEESVNLPLGTIPGFRKDGISYEAVFNNGTFLGYFDGGVGGTKFPMESIIQTRVDADATVYLYEYGGCGGSKYYSSKFFVVNRDKPFNNLNNFTLEENIPCTAESVAPGSNPLNFSLSFCEVLEPKETIETSWVTGAVSKLNTSFSKRNAVLGTVYRDKNSFYHLVNHGNTFDDRSEILEDKLYLLKEKTGVNFYVVFQQVTEKLTANKLDEMAQQILEGSDLDGESVVVVVPFIKAITGLVNVTKCMQAGFAQTSTNIIPASYFSFKTAPDLFSYIIQAYSGIEKPATITYSYLLANKDVALVEKTANNEVRGLPFIQSLAIYKSINYDEVREKEAAGRRLKNSRPKKEDYGDNETTRYIIDRKEHEEEVLSWSEQYQGLLDESIAQDKIALEAAKSGNRTPPANSFVSVPGEGVLLRSVYLNPNLNQELIISYTNLHQAQDEYLSLFVNLEYTFGSSFERVEGKHLYKEIDTHQVVFDLLDVASLALSPIGADVLPDGIGLIYAAATGHKTEAGLYLVSMGAVGISQWGVTFVKNNKRFTLVANLANDGKLVGYEIKNADEVITSANQTPMLSSRADNLDDAKKDFNDLLDVEFGSSRSLSIDDAINRELGTAVDIAEGALENLSEVKALLEAANVTGPALAKFESLEAVNSIASRFKSTKGDGVEGIKNLLLDSDSNIRKQEIIDQLVKVDEIFPSPTPITITTKRSGFTDFIQIKDPADNLVGQLTGGNITKRQILESGDKIATYDGIDILRNGDIIGFKGYANWDFPPSTYEDKIGDVISTNSSYKDVSDIVGETDGVEKVIAVMKPGGSAQTLVNEIEALAKLKAQEIPTVEVLEQVVHDGRPAIVMKRYSGSSDDIAQLRGSTVEIIGNSDAVNANSIQSLQDIKNQLIEKGVSVSDLEFLIDDTGRFVIADPVAVNLGSHSDENINFIDELVGQIRRNLDDLDENWLDANLLNKLDDFNDAVLKQKFLDDFVGASSETKALFKSKPELIDSWKGLSNRPNWVRKNVDLLEKTSDNPSLLSKVDEYYENAIPSNTPSGFNGEGVYSGVNFNKYGHPELMPHVSSPNHIVKIDMKGNYTSDMTDAKNKLIEQVFGGDATKVRKSIDPITGNQSSGWSPFQIKQADGSWSEPYTWHHHQDGTSMYPVRKEIHDAIIGKHTGGREIVTRYPELKEFFNEP